jgi:hypothetical protein
VGVPLVEMIAAAKEAAAAAAGPLIEGGVLNMRTGLKATTRAYRNLKRTTYKSSFTNK